MTDAEIKKALECCKKPVGSGACNDCPLDKNRPCTTTMIESALDLINRQQEMIDGLIAGQETLQKALAEKIAEIERLQNECFCIANERDAIKDCIDTAVEEAKAEAIKEYKNKIENDIVTLLGKLNCTEFIECLDYRYKEMVGESK